MKLKMKPRYSLAAAIVVAIPVLLLVLNTADSGSPGTNPAVKPSFGTANEQVESIGDPVQGNARPTATTEAVESSTVPEQDGTTLLQTHCAQCHSVKLLERTKKSRSDWEKTLSRMERSSGVLNDFDKFLMLEHLTSTDRQ